VPIFRKEVYLQIKRERQADGPADATPAEVEEALGKLSSAT
jgi:sRNA-binding carbon storage regulator CsrA